MTDLTGELLAAIMAAPADRKEAALKTLRGEIPAAFPTPKNEPYVTLKECAKACGISTTSLWRYKVPKISLAGRPKFLVSSVISYLNSNEFRAYARRLRKERALQGGAPCKQ
jgi:hypothetical protein